MISFYYLFLFWMLGLISTYFFLIKYVKYLRGESSKRIKDTDIMLMSIFLSGPLIIFMEFFIPEIRKEDMINRYRLLIVAVIVTIIEIVAIILLFYFGIFYWIPKAEEETKLIGNIII